MSDCSVMVEKETSALLVGLAGVGDPDHVAHGAHPLKVLTSV